MKDLSWAGTYQLKQVSKFHRLGDRFFPYRHKLLLDALVTSSTTCRGMSEKG